MSETISNHTPGPWAIRPHWSDEEKFEVYPTRPGKKLEYGQWAEIAQVSEGGDDEPAEANARLIAAAPDMFEAITAALDSGVLIGQTGDEAVSKAAMDALRAAIAKAEGRPDV